MHGNAFENVVCEKAAVLSRPQYINHCSGSEITWRDIGIIYADTKAYLITANWEQNEFHLSIVNIFAYMPLT